MVDSSTTTWYSTPRMILLRRIWRAYLRWTLILFVYFHPIDSNPLWREYVLSEMRRLSE